MFRKLVMLSMVFCLFIVQANAATHNSLKSAFDELNYALTVEWDQTDRNFYESQMNKFSATLETLQANGMTNAELVDFAVSQLKDEGAQKDLRTALSMVKINNMTQSEAKRYVTDVMNKSYNRGASWGGEVVVGVVVFVLIIAIAAIVAGKARINENEGCYEVRVCEENCIGSVCHEDCDYECVN